MNLQVVIAATLLGSAAASAQLTDRTKRMFVDVSTDVGFQPYTMAWGMVAGLAACDFDGDGLTDIFLPNGEGHADQLYRNIGGQYVEIAAEVGLASFENSRAGLWFDYDGDHDYDLVVVNDWHAAAATPAPTTVRLYRQNPDHTFTEVTAEAGLFEQLYPPGGDPRTHVSGIAAADVNGDTWVDFLFVHWNGEAHYYLNNGNGTFTPMDIGISRPTPPDSLLGSYWQPVFHDFTGDGHVDLFIAMDYGFNRLYINQGGVLHDVAVQAGVEHNANNDMGVTIGDCDGDGDFDIFVTNIHIPQQQGNALYRNDSANGQLVFTEMAQFANVDATGWGWGATFFDYNNDISMDLAVTNGFGFQEGDPTALFKNRGGTSMVFDDIAPQVGVNDDDWGSSILAVDHDRDGDLDLLQNCNRGGPLRLYENQLADQGKAGNWLVVKPRQKNANHFAIGSIVRVRIGNRWLVRSITAGTSMMGQEPAEAFFGLARASHVDEIQIAWPGGLVTRTGPVEANQHVIVTPVQRGAASRGRFAR